MKWVLFFDGECGFCNKAVRSVHALDKRNAVDFAPLQGNLARRKELNKYAEKPGGTMVMLREADGAKFYKGDAWIELGKILGGIWAMLAQMFALFPKHARDWGYDLIARNRYRIASKLKACKLPDEGLLRKMRD